MSDQSPRRSKAKTLTVAALLGIFVGAVVLAILGKLMPGRVSEITRGAVEAARRGRR